MFSVYQELREIRKELEDVRVPVTEIEIGYFMPHISDQVEKRFPNPNYDMDESSDGVHVNLVLHPADPFSDAIYLDPISVRNVFIDTGHGSINFHPDFDPTKRVYKLDGEDSEAWAEICRKAIEVFNKRGYVQGNVS